MSEERKNKTTWVVNLNDNKITHKDGWVFLLIPDPYSELEWEAEIIKAVKIHLPNDQVISYLRNLQVEAIRIYRLVIAKEVNNVELEIIRKPLTKNEKDFFSLKIDGQTIH